ncbi:hypothetical protein NECAME_01666 [Necator americanus]|uniref:Uncharacterized protein n=1 Tax=Necator americanus TaxID=51031 RepID=W2TRY5_NECAM|nr:hypothetical protein NECAME_01666 [Necator americanus]ETN84439.1 hypothetical protein NECAME_01666 [Necator americanus]
MELLGLPHSTVVVRRLQLSSEWQRRVPNLQDPKDRREARGSQRKRKEARKVREARKARKARKAARKDAAIDRIGQVNPPKGLRSRVEESIVREDPTEAREE